jgi:hypothetical protein
MMTKQAKNMQKKLEIEAKRKARTAEINRRINQEWAALNKFYANQMRILPPNTPTLNKLTALAIIDFKNRNEYDKTRLKVAWSVHGGNKIFVPYMKTIFDNFVLIPPSRYRHVRQARSLPILKIGRVKVC